MSGNRDAVRPANLEWKLVQLSAADLIRVHSVEPELEYIFRHALTHEAAYDSLLHSVRREVHRKIARTYEQLYADRLDEFAHC